MTCAPDARDPPSVPLDSLNRDECKALAILALSAAVFCAGIVAAFVTR